MSIIIDINHKGGDWPDNSEQVIERSIHAVLAHQDIVQAEASVVLSDDSFIQTLNSYYRKKDSPTNVLSFPQELPLLGDIVLAHETIAREADEQGKSFEEHLTHLSIHGTLHLLGYDHIDDDDAQEMEALEVEILESLNVKNPY